MANDSELDLHQMLWWMLSTTVHDPIHDCNRGRLSNTFVQMSNVVKDIAHAADAAHVAAAAAHVGGARKGKIKSKNIQKGGNSEYFYKNLKIALVNMQRSVVYLDAISMEYIEKIKLLFILEFPEFERALKEMTLLGIMRRRAARKKALKASLAQLGPQKYRATVGTASALQRWRAKELSAAFKSLEDGSGPVSRAAVKILFGWRPKTISKLRDHSRWNSGTISYNLSRDTQWPQSGTAPGAYW